MSGRSYVGEFLEYKQYYEHYCSNDSECLALRDSFFLSFTGDGVHLLTGQFANIHRLVYSITKRFSEKAIFSIGIQSLRMIVKNWPLHLNQSEQLVNRILYQWHRYQKGVNLIHSLTIYAHNKASRFRENQWHHLVRHLFVEYLLDQEDLFGSIVQIIDATKDVSNDKSANLVKQICNLLQYVDTDNNLLYYRIFGIPYLKLMQCRYRSKIMSSPELDPIEYLLQVEKVLCEEVEVGIRYGFTSTLTRMLAKVLYCELVTRRQNNILCSEYCHNMIESEQMDRLAYLYQIIVYDKSNLRLLVNIVERIVQSQLDEIKVPDWRSQLFSIEECNQLVDKTHRLLERWFTAVKEVFASDDLLAQAITKSFGLYLSSNQAHLYIILLFIHLVSLRRCSLVSIALSRKEAIQKAFNILSHKEDKTTVVKGNHMFLCQRLLHQLSYDAKIDAETVANWHDSMDNSHASTIRLLYKDYHKSEQWLVPYCDGAQFQVTLLNASLWSLNQPHQEFNVPRDFSLLYRQFKKNFTEKYPRKSIELNYDYCVAEISTYFEKCKTKFVVTIRQAVILLAFNRVEGLTGSQLTKITKMERQILMEQVDVFIRFGLILHEEQRDAFHINDCFQASDVGDYYHDEAINWIQLHFESTPCSIVFIMQTLNSTCNLSSSSNNSTTLESNEEVKNFRLEAAIVRVLKRVQVVKDTVTLHTMTYETLCSGANSILLPLLSMEKFQKILLSLESRGFLRLLDNGNILYEP